jgi:hypothetical protein
VLGAGGAASPDVGPGCDPDGTVTGSGAAAGGPVGEGVTPPSENAPKNKMSPARMGATTLPPPAPPPSTGGGTTGESEETTDESNKMDCRIMPPRGISNRRILHLSP